MECIEETMQCAGHYAPCELLNGITISLGIDLHTVREILNVKGMEELSDGTWTNKGSAETDWFVIVVHNDGNMADGDNKYVVRAVTCHAESLRFANTLCKLLNQFAV
ncbi:MAG: hypothetical protein J6Y37_13600 [Paludibacteraceae bacterium]|nr:hypothetical protein [Paludibacteraceae bacterium]